jgi:hypothetical protein
MATPSGAISSALPIRAFPQSWNKWSIPSAQTVIIGVIGAIFIYTIYLIVRGQSLSSRKFTTTYFPPDQLNTMGFIKIFHDCIGDTRGVVEVKAMIEDAQGRRIATRYMPRFDVNADIFARLPFNQDVFVRLKVTRMGHGQIMKEVLAPIHFRVNHGIGVYPISKGRVSASYPLAEVQSNPPVWTRNSYEPKTFRPIGVACQEINPHQQGWGRSVEMHAATYRDIYERTDIVTVESRNTFHKLVRINLFTNLDSMQLKMPLFCYVDGLVKAEFQLTWLIKNWKAAYKQETGRRIHHQSGEGNDIGNFYIEAMSYSTYQV